MTEDKAIEVKSSGTRDLQKGPQASGWSYRPRIDVTENVDEFTIRADLPGASAENISVNFENQTLMIRGNVPARQTPNVEYLMHEYGVGDFDREIILTDAIEADRINAEYSQGVLTVHVPKSEEAKPRRIPVKGI